MGKFIYRVFPLLALLPVIYATNITLPFSATLTEKKGVWGDECTPKVYFCSGLLWQFCYSPLQSPLTCAPIDNMDNVNSFAIGLNLCCRFYADSKCGVAFGQQDWDMPRWYPGLWGIGDDFKPVIGSYQCLISNTTCPMEGKHFGSSSSAASSVASSNSALPASTSHREICRPSPERELWFTEAECKTHCNLNAGGCIWDWGHPNNNFLLGMSQLSLNCFSTTTGTHTLENDSCLDTGGPKMPYRVARDLAVILKIQNSLRNEIRDMKETERRAVFESLCHQSREFLIRGNKEEITKMILLSISNPDLVHLFPGMQWDLQASILLSLRDLERSEVIKSLRTRDKDQAVTNMTNYQEWLKSTWDFGIIDAWVVTEGYPSHYPESMRKCIVCGDFYSFLQSIIATDCGKHSFHEKCEEEDGVCPNCDD
ncbi:hypothetical protein K469DRAFT_692157 [Zopfia rhizophila CBS 207.26]|uniref:RING-type domain-containing protein n=1 Tax=Zopfia rhizophila CBS 207.26 TaxID=1314779 RepID=A0A6A6DUD2_9PEZI|nr:hypothetical protein K469DRAFT_692157 [Zopfia rhizophila CBS 207.26]